MSEWPQGQGGGRGIPAIMGMAVFNPKPVADSDGAGDSQGGKNADGPGRGEKEQVNQQDNGGGSVKAEVYPVHRFCM